MFNHSMVIHVFRIYITFLFISYIFYSRLSTKRYIFIMYFASVSFDVILYFNTTYILLIIHPLHSMYASPFAFHNHIRMTPLSLYMWHMVGEGRRVSPEATASSVVGSHLCRWKIHLTRFARQMDVPSTDAHPPPPRQPLRGMTLNLFIDIQTYI